MPLPQTLLRRSWIAALLLALGLVFVDAVSRIRHVAQVSGIPGEMVERPAVDPKSPSGYTLGRRMMIVPGTGGDAYHWIAQTQAMLAGAGARIRHVDYDNAPTGRAVHWASLYRWWLGALAWADRVATGHPPGIAVERAALYSNPLLLALLLVGVVPLVARRFGSVAASVVAIGLATLFPFNVFFAADYPDHHGIIAACALVTVLALLAGGSGFVRAPADAANDAAADKETATNLPSSSSARRWFAGSAVAGGIGLWVSAASQIPVLVGVGFGALATGWLGRGIAGSGIAQRDPTLWRIWGAVGGAVSVGAYLVEYFPHHLGLRLEVNHPLYAVAWLGAGELLCRFHRIVEAPKLRPTRSDVIAVLAALIGVLAAPAVILVARDRAFAVLDRYVWQLGAEYVAEGESFRLALTRNGFDWRAAMHFLPLLLILPPLGLLVGWRGSRLSKLPVALALGPALLLLGLTLEEMRWWGMAMGLVLVALLPVFPALESAVVPVARRRWLVALCAVLLLPGVGDVARVALRAPPSDIRQLVERDLAQWLRQRLGTERGVVACSPGLATNLIYYGDCPVLGTLYWENTDGIKRAAALLAARTPDQARDLARQWGVTHLVLPSWDTMAENLVRFERGAGPNDPVPEDSFVRFLRRGGVPRWLRLIPYPLPRAEVLQGHVVLVFEVTPEQSPATAATYLMDYLLAMDATGTAAAATARQLERYPADLPAQIQLACYYGRAAQQEAFTATFPRLVEGWGGIAALGVEDRIRLALVLAAAGQKERASEQLGEVLARLDERSLRRMTPDTLGNLLRLMDTFGAQIADPSLQALALTLYPPMFRRSS